MYRISIDNYEQTNRRFINIGGPQQPNGELSTFNVKNVTNNHVLNLMYQYDLSSSLKLDGIVGFNSQSLNYDVNGVSSSQQFVYGLFTHDNFISHNGFSGMSQKNVTGLYATAALSYNGWLYVTGQVRNDWTSTLEQENRSNLYPSISASFVLSDAITGLQSSKAVDYLKLRVGYGTSAGYPDP